MNMNMSMNTDMEWDTDKVRLQPMSVFSLITICMYGYYKKYNTVHHKKRFIIFSRLMSLWRILLPNLTSVLWVFLANILFAKHKTYIAENYNCYVFEGFIVIYMSRMRVRLRRRWCCWGFGLLSTELPVSLLRRLDQSIATIKTQKIWKNCRLISHWKRKHAKSINNTKVRKRNSACFAFWNTIKLNFKPPYLHWHGQFQRWYCTWGCTIMVRPHGPQLLSIFFKIKYKKTQSKSYRKKNFEKLTRSSFEECYDDKLYTYSCTWGKIKF
jgi:hypothetical protein